MHKTSRQLACSSTLQPVSEALLTYRSHVAVAHGRHGDYGPPKGVGYALEVGGFGVCFSKIDGAGKQNHPNEEKEDEQAELAHGGLKSLAEDLQAFRMSGQLEDSEDSHQANDSEYGQRHGLIVRPVFVRYHCSQRYEVGNNGHDVDAVHQVAEKRQFLWTGSKPYKQF